MKHSIKRKFTVIGASAIVGFICMNILLTYLFMIPFSVKISTRQLEKIASELEKQNMQGDEVMQNYIDQMEEDMSTRITVFDDDLNILFTTSTNTREKNEIDKESFNGKLFVERKNELDAGKSVSVSRDIVNSEGGRIRIVLLKKISEGRYTFLSRSYRSLQNTMKSSILFELVSGCVLLVLGLIVVRYWAYYFVTPIEQMTDAAEHISNLEFDTKVEVRTEDEMGQLARAINRMSDHLEANVEQLQEDIENRKRLVRNISHEIKSPVAVIMGYADRMKAVITKNPEKAISYCEIISDESSRVDSLVKEMLEFSKIEQGQEEVDIEKIAAARLFTDLKKRFYQENIDTQIQYIDSYEKEGHFYADYEMMERAVYNLIRNATTYAAGDPAVIRVSGEWNGDYYEIKVYNSGSYVPEEDKQSIWEPFGKVDKVRGRSKKGYGLGLSIVREIVEKHHGYYKVNNTDDGVEFIISAKNTLKK